MIKYLKVDIRPKYWDDSEINGKYDISPKEQNKRYKPKMPFVYYNVGDGNGSFYKISFTIDLDEGNIINWPENCIANIFYEVIEGKYTLLDENNEIVCEYVNGEVPTLLDTTGESHGEYIELGHVYNNGQIISWHNSFRKFDKINDFLDKHFEIE